MCKLAGCFTKGTVLERAAETGNFFAAFDGLGNKIPRSDKVIG
jgi:hypothetical protein